MRYILLAYQDEGIWGALSIRERETLEAACQENERYLQESGRLLGIERDPKDRTAVRVQILNGKLSLAEVGAGDAPGPLTGVFLIDAMDLNEAIQVAAKMPQARFGSIEVRSMLE